MSVNTRGSDIEIAGDVLEYCFVGAELADDAELVIGVVAVSV